MTENPPENPRPPGSRRAPNVPPKYAYLLEDPNVARWHRHLAKGSLATSREYLRFLGIFTTDRKQTPAEFIAMGQRSCEDALHDWVNARVLEGKLAGSSIDYHASVIQSWMKWNDIPLRRAVKLPTRNYHPRVKEYHIPSLDELRRVLALCDGRQKMVLALIGYAGIRPGALGNLLGDDGLRFSDLLDAQLVAGKLVFDQVPTRVRIREELSKAKHEYFTMLGPEGCEYISAYAGQRTNKGERLGPDSPLLPSQHASQTFMQSESIGDMLRRPMREAGVKLPPYIWRSYFNNRALLAEADGFVRDYRVFFMGHKGDIEHTYALRKQVGEDMIEQMRRAYMHAARRLESRAAERREDPMLGIAKSILVAGGVKQDALAKVDLAGSSEAALVQLLVGAATRSAPAPALAGPSAQRVVNLEEMRRMLELGWRFTVKLAEDAYVIEAPR